MQKGELLGGTAVASTQTAYGAQGCSSLIKKIMFERSLRRTLSIVSWHRQSLTQKEDFSSSRRSTELSIK